MPYAIELFFDGRSDAAIRSLWAKFAADGICDYMAASQARPHISLSVFDDAKVDDIHGVLERFVSSHRRMSLDLTAQGRFLKTEIIFLSPKPSVQLVEMQRWLDAELQQIGAQVWPQYRPDHWFPHCTLAMKAASDKAGQVARLIDDHGLRDQVKLIEIGIVHYPPSQLVKSFPLSE
jgi:2'-5' RNA ligase